MPDANGAFKGLGWSQRSSDAWTRIFGPKPPSDADVQAMVKSCVAVMQPPVPAEPAREVDDWTPEDYDQRRSAFKASD